MDFINGLMMDMFIVIIFCVLGILLILLEMFLIPGITLAAAVGTISTGWGIYHAFYSLGFYGGLSVLVLTMILIVLSVIYIVKSKLLNKIALDARIDSTIETEKISNIAEGDEGITLSRLNPIGKVEVNHIVMEGKSISHLIDEDTLIIVLKVTPTQLIVKKKESRAF